MNEGEMFGDFPYLADQDDMRQAMNEQEQMYVTALRQIWKDGYRDEAKLLAAGCGIDFTLINKHD